MKFLLDENVPHSVITVLVQCGHTVELATNVTPPGSPDPIVAAASEELGAVLISADSDFKSIAPRIHVGRIRFRRLSRIALKCNETQSAQRLEKAMSLIEAEYEIAKNSADKRMIVAIGKSWIRTDR
jgi:predicted nuclease of predicted toxin-antitoxin system